MSKLPLSLLVASAALLTGEIAAATYGPSFYPNDEFFAYNATTLPNFAGQWHLVNTAPTNLSGMADNAHLDVNIRGAWSMGVTGKGVVIGIIDDGIEGDHEDLAANYRADLSKIFSQDESLAGQPQRPIQPDDDHGTAVAGVAAAVGGNKIGVTGAAPFAALAGQRIKLGGDAGADVALTPRDQADAFLWKSGVTENGNYTGEAEIHVKNNSWGMGMPFYNEGTNTFDKTSIEYKAVAQASANNVIILFAAGNERGDVGTNGGTRFLNQAEPVIEVAAFGSDGIYSAYSNYGASIFVTAPSNSTTITYGITTTDRMGSNFGYNTYVNTGTASSPAPDLPNANYTSTFGGTSSATPLVSGIVALGKQVAPTMDVRLAKHALASTARLVDAADKSLLSVNGRGWVTNAAGYHFNSNYGFGLVDATAFVNKVIDSAYVTDRTVARTGTISVEQVIPVASATGLTQKFTISTTLAKQPIETVEFGIKMTGDNTWKDLSISTTSPSGTTTDLLLFNNFLQGLPADFVAGYESEMNAYVPGFDWVFTANAFWGENAAGEWSIFAQNRGVSNITWNNFHVTINMGAMVLERDTAKLHIQENTTVKAHSLNLDHSATLFVVDHGGTFTVTDSFNIYGGTADILGTVNEAAPSNIDVNPDPANAAFFKGGQVNVGAKGTVTVREGATLTASRGVVVDGGTFSSFGTLTIPGGVTVANAGYFHVAQSLDLPGPVSVQNGTFALNSGTAKAPDGTLRASTLTLNGGTISVPKSISAQTGHISGGTLVTEALHFTGSQNTGTEALPNLASATITGGTIRSNTLTATEKIILSGGILDITGRINATQLQLSGGYYSPGGINRLGSSTLSGALSISAQGGLLTDVRMTRQADNSHVFEADILHVQGRVDLGGTLYINRLNNTQINYEDKIPLITSNTGISGTMASSGAIITPTLHLEIQLEEFVAEDGTIVHNGVAYGVPVRNYAFSGLSLTPNQRIVGSMLNTLHNLKEAAEASPGAPPPVLPPVVTPTGPGPVPAPPIDTSTYDPEFDYDAIFQALDSFDQDAQLRHFYDVTMPYNNVVLHQSLQQQVRGQTNAFKSRAREARSAFIQPASLWSNPLFGDAYGFNYSSALSSNPNSSLYSNYRDEAPVTLWLNGGASFAPGRGNAASSSFDSYGYNATIGADYCFSEQFLLGALIGYSGTDTDFQASGIKNEGTSILFGAYAAGHARGFYYNLLLGASTDSYTLKRDVFFANASDLNGRFRGKPNGLTFVESAEIGFEWRSPETLGGNTWAFGPTLSLQYYYGSIDAYTESGPSWQRLTVDKQKLESLTTSLGWRASRIFNFRAATLQPEIHAAWIHEFFDDARDITSAIQVPGAQKFTIHGIKPARDYANIGLNLSVLLSGSLTITGEYDCYFFQKNMDPTHQVSATLRYSF
ncbi:MAG: autotransporter domain-containing protein [Puniceicoccales bacterium]|jgi:subtilisin family serine protease/uncharacterized protein YhjY with autotransporter beta-barrel domain|nr:autotransporter domain-containing protein [Puniceicoccales bacterium]